MGHEEQLDILELEVPTIGCSGCVESITEELEALSGIEGVVGDAGAKQIKVEFQPREVGEDQIRKAIERAGHSVA